MARGSRHSPEVRVRVDRKVTDQRVQGPHWITSVSVSWAGLILACILVGLSLLRFDPVFVVVAVCGIIGLVFLFHYPFLGVLGYLVFEYARVAVMFPVLRPLQVGKLIVVATFAAWALQAIGSTRVHLVRDKTNIILIVWLMLALVSSFWSIESKLALIGAQVFLSFVGSYLLIVHLVDTMPKWRWAIWVLLLLHLKISQFQIRSFFRDIPLPGERYTYIAAGVGAGMKGPFANATDLGAAMVMIVPVALALIKSTRSKPLRLLALASLGAFLISILLSGSRGAAVALLAVATAYWFKSRNKIAMGLAVIVLAVGFWGIAPPEYKQRFFSGIEYSQDATASARLRFWRFGIEMLADHPITGIGMGNFRPAYAAAGGTTLHVAHSIWVEAGSELGLPGLLMLFSVLYLGFKRNYQVRKILVTDDADTVYMRDLSHALDVSLVGFMVAGTFTSILYYPFLFTTLAFIISLHEIAQKKAGLRRA